MNECLNGGMIAGIEFHIQWEGTSTIAVIGSIPRWCNHKFAPSNCIKINEKSSNSTGIASGFGENIDGLGGFATRTAATTVAAGWRGIGWKDGNLIVILGILIILDVIFGRSSFASNSRSWCEREDVVIIVVVATTFNKESNTKAMNIWNRGFEGSW